MVMVEPKEKNEKQKNDSTTLKEFAEEILNKKEEDNIKFHKRKDQRYPISMMHKILSELNADEISEIFDKYKDLFTPGMLGAAANSHSGKSNFNSFIGKLNPKDKAFIAKKEIKGFGSCKYLNRRFANRPKLKANYDVRSKEFFEELTGLQTAKFIMGLRENGIEKLANKIGIEFFKQKMKKRIFRDNDDRAKKALDYIKKQGDNN